MTKTTTESHNDPPSRTGILDFFFNSWEHEPTSESARASLLENRCSEALAADLVASWEKERPDLKRGANGKLALDVQQEAAEELVDRVMARHGLGDAP